MSEPEESKARPGEEEEEEEKIVQGLLLDVHLSGPVQ